MVAPGRGRNYREAPMTQSPDGPRLPLPVVIVAAAVGATLLGDSMLYAVMPSQRETWGLSVAAVGVLLSANRLIRLVSNPLAAAIFNRYGPRTPFAGALILSVLVTATYGWTTAFVTLLVARMLWGVAWSALRLGGYWAVLDAATDERRGLLMGTYTSIVRLGSIGGTVAGALLTDAIGHRWTLSLFSAVIAAAGMAWLLATRRGAAAIAQAANVAVDEPGGFSSVLRDRRLLATSAGGLVAGLVFAGLVTASLGFFLRERYGDEIAFAGLAVGVTSATGLLLGGRFALGLPLGPLSGYLSDRFGRSRVTVAAFLVGSVGLVLLAVAGALWLTFVGLLLSFASAAALVVVLAASAGDLAPPARRAAVMTTYATFLDLGAALGPLLGLSFGSLFALRGMLLGSAVALLVAAAWYRAAFAGERAAASPPRA